MRYLKLFENFVLENYSRGKSIQFNMPDLYEMPSGLSKNKVYVVKLSYECENAIYSLMDYSQLEMIYESLNLYLISDKIHWYSQILYSDMKIDPANPLYAQEVLVRKSWNIEIFAETDGNMFPYYVYVHGQSDSSIIKKKLDELSKECKVCVDPPSVKFTLPGQITCAVGSNDVVFDPGMGMKLSDVIYDDSGTHESPNEDHMYGGKGYYIRFDSLGAFLAVYHPSYDEFARFKKGNKFIVDNSKIFELLEYRPDLVFVRDLITKKEGARDFLDDIFTYLIDIYTPQHIIKSISNILNPDDYQVEKSDFYKVEFYDYIKGWSEKNKKYSEYPNFINGEFFLALPNDKSIVNAILNKLPKDYNEIYEGLDSADKSFLQKVKDNYEYDFPTLDSFIEMLKNHINIIKGGIAIKQQASIFDGKFPSIDVFMEESKCSISYGIYNKITLDEINRLSPIELYLDIFYLKKFS